jgi:hypothetical protein
MYQNLILEDIKSTPKSQEFNNKLRKHSQNISKTCIPFFRFGNDLIIILHSRNVKVKMAWSV